MKELRKSSVLNVGIIVRGACVCDKKYYQIPQEGEDLRGNQDTWSSLFCENISVCVVLFSLSVCRILILHKVSDGLFHEWLQVKFL